MKATPWKRLLRVLPSLAVLASVGFSSRPALAELRDWLLVEVGRDAARLVDPRLAERLIALETADVEVPAPPRVSQKPPLYFRVLAPTTTTLRVELWELGEPYGFRRVSAAGTENLRARRLALAAGELTRQLRRRRLSEIEAARLAEAEARNKKNSDPGFPIYGRFVLDAGVRAAAIGLGDAWFVGPDLGLSLVFSSGQRISLGAAWLAGEAESASRARWLELGLSVAQRFVVAPSSALDVGVEAALASLRVDGSLSNEGTSPLDAATGRAGLTVRWEQRFGRYFGVAIGPDLGVILHPVTGRAADGAAERTSGLWLGGAATFRLDPGAP